MTTSRRPMKYYLDSSVLLRRILFQRGMLPEWPQINEAFSSQLLHLECLRAIDRTHQRGILDDAEAARAHQSFFALYRRLSLLPVTPAVLHRAEQRFLNPLGALDSIHLATALLWRETRGEEFTIATHDRELALAATAHGFAVIGAG